MPGNHWETTVLCVVNRVVEPGRLHRPAFLLLFSQPNPELREDWAANRFGGNQVYLMQATVWGLGGRGCRAQGSPWPRIQVGDPQQRPRCRLKLVPAPICAGFGGLNIAKYWKVRCEQLSWELSSAVFWTRALSCLQFHKELAECGREERGSQPQLLSPLKSKSRWGPEWTTFIKKSAERWSAAPIPMNNLSSYLRN